MKSTSKTPPPQELTMCHCRNFAFLFVIYNDFQLSLDSYIIMYLIVFMVAWCLCTLHFLCRGKYRKMGRKIPKPKTLISVEYPQMDGKEGILLLIRNMCCVQSVYTKI